MIANKTDVQLCKQLESLFDGYYMEMNIEPTPTHECRIRIYNQNNPSAFISIIRLTFTPDRYECALVGDFSCVDEPEFEFDIEDVITFCENNREFLD